jgi:anionic cell wall polymer biosynthesis LytR-Cps2A-Psr (LCP) family protein
MAVIDMVQYMSLVDLMGGLTITPEVTHADPCRDEDLVWNAGTAYEFSGLEALCYVRGRKAYGGDLDRNRRVLEIVKAAMSQWPAAIAHDPTRALDLYKGVASKDLFQTDADLATVVSLLDLLPRLPDAEMRFLRFALNDVDFASDPLYGSILVSNHDLPTWTACLLETGEACEP